MIENNIVYVEQNPFSPPVHIGDGVFARYNGYTIRLHTDSNDVIYLEPPVLRALVDYAKKCYGEKTKK